MSAHAIKEGDVVLVGLRGAQEVHPQLAKILQRALPGVGFELITVESATFGVEVLRDAGRVARQEAAKPTSEDDELCFCTSVATCPGCLRAKDAGASPVSAPAGGGSW